MNLNQTTIRQFLEMEEKIKHRVREIAEIKYPDCVGVDFDLDSLRQSDFHVWVVKSYAHCSCCSDDAVGMILQTEWLYDSSENVREQMRLEEETIRAEKEAAEKLRKEEQEREKEESERKLLASLQEKYGQ